VWFIAHAVNAVVFLWHVSQVNDVGMCVVAGLPFAVVPLWQVAHWPATLAGCVKVAPANDVVLEWHVSHAAVVATCVVDFVFTPANWPPWQVAHPVVIPVWFIAHAVNVVVFLWHVSQVSVVGICPVAGLPFAVVPLWQVAHCPAIFAG